LSNGKVRKFLYFGEDLVGVAEDESARQAKIKCAKEGIKNVLEGKTASKKTYAKNGKTLSNKRFRTYGHATVPRLFSRPCS